MNKKLIGRQSLTSIVLTLDVRLLAVTLFEFPVALGLMGPDHEARVAAADRHQEAVVMGPSHIGNMCAVGHIALELCILPLRERDSICLIRVTLSEINITFA